MKNTGDIEPVFSIIQKLTTLILAIAKQYVNHIKYYKLRKTIIRLQLTLKKSQGNLKEKVTNTGDKIWNRSFFSRRMLLCSDDENIHPSTKEKRKSLPKKKLSDEKWIFVSETNDCRPSPLPDFLQLAGPTFVVPPNPNPSDFYNQTLPDSLFEHIAKCTNIRAKLHFTNVDTNGSSWREVKQNRSIYDKRRLNVFVLGNLQ